MATIYPEVGTFAVALVEFGANEYALEIRWTADANGDAVRNLGVLSGVLTRLATHPTVANTAGTHNVYLYDEYGVDMLDGRGASLADNVSDTVLIYRAAAADIALPIVLAGPHTFRVSGADASDEGFTTLYMRP